MSAHAVFRLRNALREALSALQAIQANMGPLHPLTPPDMVKRSAAASAELARVIGVARAALSPAEPEAAKKPVCAAPTVRGTPCALPVRVEVEFAGEVAKPLCVVHANKEIGADDSRLLRRYVNNEWRSNTESGRVTEKTEIEKSIADIAADICFGSVGDWQVKIEKALAKERQRAETFRDAWNRVSGERNKANDEVVTQRARAEKAEAERDDWQAQAARLNEANGRLIAERDDMKAGIERADCERANCGECFGCRADAAIVARDAAQEEMRQLRAALEDAADALNQALVDIGHDIPEFTTSDAIDKAHRAALAALAPKGTR